MEKAPATITLWAVGKKHGGLFLQNGYPFFATTKDAAKHWCDNDEKPVKVRITIVKK